MGGFRNKGIEFKSGGFLTINEYQKDELGFLPFIYINSSRNRFVRLLRFFLQIMDYILIIFYRPDIVHSTYYPQRFAPLSSAKRLVTVYDLVHEEYPDYFNQVDKIIARKRKAVCSADHLICISESTKNSLLNFYGIAESKISVVHLAISDRFFRKVQTFRNFPQRSAQFILFVGPRSGYKNFEFLIRQLGGLKLNIGLVCFGGPKFSREEILLISREGLQSSVEWIGGGDGKLIELYFNCRCLVICSLMEGFGLPIIEAMVTGTPVVCPDLPVFREVSKGRGFFYSGPKDFPDMLRRGLVFKERANNSKAINDLVKVGESYTVEKMVESTLKVYEEVRCQK